MPGTGPGHAWWRKVRGPSCHSSAAALNLSIPRLRWLAYHADASPVSHYAAPNPFTGRLRKVTVTMEEDQGPLDGEGIGRAQLARE